MLEHEQLPRLSVEDFHVFDFDVVEEQNCRHQDFTMIEVGTPKAMVMSIRYGFPARIKRFDNADLGSYNRYLICADNPGVRRLVYEHAKTTNKQFVDMRCEGDLMSIFTHRAELTDLMASLGAEPQSTEGRSCQLVEDVANNVIQLGNFAVAPVGMQVLLNMMRKESYPARIVKAVA
jgi:hypothetical protein